MLRLARILRPAHRDRAWILSCDRCGHGTRPVTHAVGLELDQTACIDCEMDPAWVEAQLDAARVTDRVWRDVN
jgi:hypothetical protein